MNVLIFSHSSGLGGAERSLLTLVTDLITSYHTQVTIVLPPDGPSIGWLQNAGASILAAPINMWCTVEDVPDPEAILNIHSQSMDWLIENRNALTVLNPDIVLTNTIVIPWGSVAAAMLRRPHIWMINEFGELDHGFNFYLPFNQVLRLIEKSSDMIVTRSNAIKDAVFPHLKPDKVKTIYRSIDLPIQGTNPESGGSEEFQGESTFRLAVIGTIRESKGQQDAVRAVIELVNKRNRQVELIMVGGAEEPFRNELERLARDSGIDQNIQILPFHEHVHRIIDQVDIVLVCSRMEAFGRVVLEGMLLGKPIIGTNTGGTPEMIIDGETGLLYEPGNITQLADQIEKLIDDPTLRQKIGQKGFEFAQSTFTKENYSGEFQKLFVEIAQNDYQAKGEFSSFLLDLLVDLNDHKNAEFAELKTQNKNLQQEVLSYALSTSWRMTRPFRRINRLLKRK